MDQQPSLCELNILVELYFLKHIKESQVLEHREHNLNGKDDYYFFFLAASAAYVSSWAKDVIQAIAVTWATAVPLWDS